jgi:hypothetical protein
MAFYPLNYEGCPYSMPYGLLWLGSKAECLSKLFLVESDDDLIINSYNGHGHSSALFDHLCTALHIARNIELAVGYAVFFKKFLTELAKVAGRGAVNNDVFFGWHDVIKLR